MSSATAPASSPASDRADEQVRGESVERLYAGLPTALIAVVCTTALVAWELTSVVSPGLVGLWSSASLGVCGLRVLDRKLVEHRGLSPREAERHFIVGALLNGAVWGSTALMMTDALPHAVVIVFVVGGLAAGASTTSAASLTAFIAYSLPAMLPIVVRLATFGTQAHLAMAGALSVFIGALTLLTRRNGQALLSDIRFRLHQGRVVEMVRRSSDERVGRLRRLLDNAGVVFLVAEVDTLRVIDSSESTRDLLGLDPGQIRGRSLADLEFSIGHELRTEAHWRAITARARDRTITRGEGNLEALVSVCQVVGCEYVLVIVRDVTERRELEAQVTHASLHASLGSLAAGLAHEINSPLAYISANLAFLDNALRDRGAGREVHAALADALEGARRVASIVADLGATARREPDAAERADVERLLNTAVHVCEHEVLRRAHVVRRFGGVPAARAQPLQLTHVFLNLVLNAAQAIPEGRPGENTIELETRLDEAHDRIRVVIRDSGGGIPSENVGRIFEPFFTTRGAGSGRGLGLSVSLRLVRDMGGTLNVKSEPGVGTELTLELERAPEVRRSTAAARVTGRLGGPLRIVAIDDDERVLAALRRLLDGHEVEVFPSAHAALAYLEACTEVDAILCDVMMPGMSGSELFAQLEQVRPDLCMRMVFITGGAFTDETVEFLQRTSSPTLSKPFQRSALLETLHRAARRAEHDA